MPPAVAGPPLPDPALVALADRVGATTGAGCALLCLTPAGVTVLWAGEPR